MTFNNSTHKFTDPIRVFKANDPYHFVIDNLPLQQLMENDRWLKDQIDFVQEVATSANDGIDRSGFNELKPFANGTDNIVYVNPGQYHSRINDAYSVSSLQNVRLFNQFVPGQFRQYAGSISTNAFNDFVANLQGTLESNSMNLNGLSERVFQIPLTSPDAVLPYTIVDGKPSITGAEDGYQWPLLNGAPFWRSFQGTLGSFLDLPKISAEFVKMYRGVGRMSVVNVHEELQIEIPPFDANDFKVDGANTTATSRIDLVFIYSHPIDANSTTLNSFTNGTPIVINKPTLGILKGAGAVFTTNTNLNNANTVTEVVDEDNNSQILGNAADENNSNNGFKQRNIHGSFPLPEDLMNLAPNLVEGLETSSFQLIGQTVFPVCYVRVKADANINVGGSQVITNDDIIDIRPFFKTNELTYNERAGILMASPPLSPANPAVGQFQLDYQLNSVFNQLNTRITSIQQGSDEAVIPRVVGGGTIWGGKKFGPEGAIRMHLAQNLGENDPELFRDIPVLPDWDLADWWTYNVPSQDNGNAGQRRNDYINSYYAQGGEFDVGTGTEDPTDINNSLIRKRLGNEAWKNSLGDTCIHWCQKRIDFVRPTSFNMVDYTVDVTLENCIHQTSRFQTDYKTRYFGMGGISGIWVEKKPTYFVIYISWIANQIGRNYVSNFHNSDTGEGREPRRNRDAFGYSGFAIRTLDLGWPGAPNNLLEQLKQDSYPNGAAGDANGRFSTVQIKNPRMGACTYPTVSFKITGFPQGYFNRIIQKPTGGFSNIILK